MYIHTVSVQKLYTLKQQERCLCTIFLGYCPADFQICRDKNYVDRVFLQCVKGFVQTLDTVYVLTIIIKFCRFFIDIRRNLLSSLNVTLPKEDDRLVIEMNKAEDEYINEAGFEVDRHYDDDFDHVS